MSVLSGKKILMLSPSFFGYEKEIKNELEGKGATVFWYDERPKNDFFTKVIIRLNLKVFIKKNIYKYYNNIIEQTKNSKIDYLFLVSPETINKELINKIKYFHPSLKVYIYMWDSIKNKKNGFSLLSIADKFFTFDPDDIKINPKIKFLPLFYVSDYRDLRSNVENIRYDICFVGTLHSDRYKIIKELEKYFIVFHYLYSPNRLLFQIQKLLKNSFRNIDPRIICFEFLKKEELLKTINESKAILDIEHPKQKGLTMRTIEMLGARKKLITTNSNIIHYDFFNEANILVIDRSKPFIDKKFLEIQYVELDSAIYNKYSLSSWIEHIFAVVLTH